MKENGISWGAACSEGLVTSEMCHAVVSRYAMNEELCLEEVGMLHEYLLCQFTCVARFMFLLCDLSFLYFWDREVSLFFTWTWYVNFLSPHFFLFHFSGSCGLVPWQRWPLSFSYLAAVLPFFNYSDTVVYPFLLQLNFIGQFGLIRLSLCFFDTCKM